MDFNILCCQVCVTKCKRISDFKKHLHSEQHGKKMKEVFQEDMFSGHGFFPLIAVMHPLKRNEFKQPIIGLSLLTLCFSTKTNIFFYLCHACEEKCPPERLVHHLSSANHCSNYFNYTDPNALRFSWVPGMNMRAILRPELTKEAKERGTGQLQMLNLPATLLKELESKTYSQVMRTLSENDKLLKLIEAVKPKRMMIQTYQRDSKRKHPLLGMQHLIECICVGLPEKRYYLCTLCNLTLATHMIIKHVLSFDHIFSYFRTWHPSTLLSKECYMDYTKSFASMILDFAKQTEKIHGTAHANMKQVNLEPAKFTAVNFTCYAEALKELESITKENKEDSLIPVVKPGEKLVCRIVSAYKLRCQNCKSTFETIFKYYKHLSEWKHEQMLEKFFGKVEGPDAYNQTGWRPSLALYKHLKLSLKQNQPVVGVSLVVACASTQMCPIYVCFACQDCFEESFLMHHFDSRKHLINTLLFQNPWRLPFAWENHLDVEFLRSMALEEERDRGPDQMTLKVLDMPFWMFRYLIKPTYRKVMLSLDRQHTLLKCEVPRCETYSKLKQNKRFPLLGQKFIVMHDVCDQQNQVKVGFLCLLCKKRSSNEDWYAHVFSREHVTTFLDHFHPGSLNSSTDAETLLDLAGSAALDHPISHVQEIELQKPIWEPCNYQTAKHILASAKKRAGKGELELPIIPKGKLVPTEILRDVDKGHVTENSPTNSQMMQKQTSQISTDNSETILKTIKAEVGVEITNNHCAERGENAGKGDDKDAPSEKESEVFSKTSSEKIKAEVSSETCLVVKEEKIEEPTFRNPSGEAPDCCQNTDKTDGTEIGEKTSNDITGGLTQLTNYKSTENERKRSRSMSEKSQEDTCPNVDEKEVMGHKKQRLTSKQDASCEEPQNLPNNKQEVTTTDEEERHKTAMNTGLDALLECHCDQRDPVYLCECCPPKIPEKGVLSHVTRAEHQKTHLMVVDMEIDDDSEDSETQPSSVTTAGSVMTETTGEGPPESNQDVKKIQIKVPESAGNADTCLTVSRSSEDTSSLQMSTRGTNTNCLHPDSTGKDVKAEIISDTTAGPLNTATTVSPVTTSTKSMTAISKCPARSSNSTTDTIKSTATLSGLRATASSCTTTTATPTNVPATITKQNVVYPKSSTTSQIENCSKYSETASQTMVTFVHCGNTQARSVKSERKNPSKEPSHTSASKTKSRRKPKVGLNQLIVVSCEEKKQVYCQLCTVRLLDSNHVTSFSHQLNYVKMRFPGWTAEMSELKSKLKERVYRLAKDEKDIRFMTTQVKMDVYKELEALPEDRAIERLKAMMRQKDSQGSSSMADSAQILRLQVAFTSPCGASSPDDEVKMETPQVCAEYARFAQIPDTCQDTADQKFEDPQKVLEGTQKTSPAKSFNLDLLPSAASVRTEQQSQSRPTSYLSLMVKGTISQPVIGLGCVWECRGESLEWFYLCEICRETLSMSDIRKHMVSVQHRWKYLKMYRPKWYWMFWQQEDLDFQWKVEILQGVAQMISEQECYAEVDAQVVLLKQDSFKHIQTAPFSKGSTLKSVQNIKKEPQLTCLPISTLQQKDLQPEDGLRREESFPTEKQSTQALGAEQRSDNEKCLPTRKRPAATPLETLVRPCINNPQLEGPLPAKGSGRSLQPSTESASKSSPDNPAATSTLLSPGSDKQDASIESNMVNHLVQLALRVKRQRNVNTHGETDSTSCGQFPINTVITTRPPHNPPIYIVSERYKGFLPGSDVHRVESKPLWTHFGNSSTLWMGEARATAASSSALASECGKGTHVAVHLGPAPVTAPVKSSQMIYLNDYSTKRLAPTQNSKDVMTQNTPHVYLKPPVFQYAPTANSEITSQAPSNSLFTVPPPALNFTPPISHETFC